VELLKRIHRHARLGSGAHPGAGHCIQHPCSDAHESAGHAGYRTADHAKGTATNYLDALPKQRVPRVDDGPHVCLVRIMLYD